MNQVVNNFKCLRGLFQVFLHTAEELPQVRDLGFAIPPGTHALVGVRLNEVSVQGPMLSEVSVLGSMR